MEHAWGGEPWKALAWQLTPCPGSGPSVLLLCDPLRSSVRSLYTYVDSRGVLAVGLGVTPLTCKSFSFFGCKREIIFSTSQGH